MMQKIKYGAELRSNSTSASSAPSMLSTRVSRFGRNVTSVHREPVSGRTNIESSSPQ